GEPVQSCTLGKLRFEVISKPLRDVRGAPFDARQPCGDRHAEARPQASLQLCGAHLHARPRDMQPAVTIADAFGKRDRVGRSGYEPFASTFAKVSRSPTVRTKTGFPGAESRSRWK